MSNRIVKFIESNSINNICIYIIVKYKHWDRYLLSVD